MSGNENAGGADCASPACYLHEVDPQYAGLSAAPPPLAGAELAAWRTRERDRLLARRLALSATTRAIYSHRIAESLVAVIGDPAGRVISGYWPIRGEPDLRPWLATIRRQGATTALPVAAGKAMSLRFRRYDEGDRLVRGVGNIPVPADGEELVPDVVIAPVVAYDSDCYRLGYGTGSFDRTLAALPGRPLVIGVGYDHAGLTSIHPQPHDIAMHMIVTELGILAPQHRANDW